MTPEFLSSPVLIRRAVAGLAQRATKMDLAVGFIGRDWRDSLANFDGKLRVVCWLSSTNTDPRAVRQLMVRPNTEVRQRDGMHAKVYIAPRHGGIVGSANLSIRALAQFEQNGRDEAGVLLKDYRSLDAINAWFRAIWLADDTRHITKTDLSRALIAFRKARRNRFGRGGPNYKSDYSVVIRKRAQQDLLELADRVRGINIARLGWLRDVQPKRIARSKLEEIIDEFERWMDRRFLFERAFLKSDISRVRKALAVLFDESTDISTRLEHVIKSGALAPLRVSSLSMLLYWRKPQKYPPFNRRTKKFLKDFGLGRRGISNASPAAYKRWLDYAEQLSQEINLPTPGHIDRLVWRYTEPMQL